MSRPRPVRPELDSALKSMTNHLSVRRALQRIIDNPRMTCKARRAALAQLIPLGAPAAFLERLMRDKSLPVRLLDDVLVAYSAKMEIRAWKREHKKTAAAPNVLGIRPDLSD